MAYQRKTKDEWQLQGNWGYGEGWEYLFAAADSSLEERRKLRQMKEGYKRNDPSARYRIMCRRVPLTGKII